MRHRVRAPAQEPPTRRARGVEVARRTQPHLKGWLDWDGDFLVGPRYIKLLEGVERTGSIRAACRGTGLGYRSSLQRIRRMERTLDAPMVLTRRGGAERGGATLTPVARDIVRVYRLWREDMEEASRRAFARATAALRRAR